MKSSDKKMRQQRDGIRHVEERYALHLFDRWTTSGAATTLQTNVPVKVMMDNVVRLCDPISVVISHSLVIEI